MPAHICVEAAIPLLDFASICPKHQTYHNRLQARSFAAVCLRRLIWNRARALLWQMVIAPAALLAEVLGEGAQVQ